MLDGFNINNDLDPAISGGNLNPASVTALPGRSQGLNIDTSLLESISVQDSNVSAAYGGFSGGVVEANTRKAKQKFAAKASYQITQCSAEPNAFSLTKYHLYGNVDNFLNSTSDSNQPNFIKHVFRASAESKITDNAGIIASFTTTQSFIPLNAYAASQIQNTLDSARKEQKRQSYNLFLKGNYDFSEDISLEASYAYIPQFNNYFIVNTKDSDFNLVSGGHQLGLKSNIANPFGNLVVQSNFNYLENSRKNSELNMRIWRYSTTKNWNPNGNNSEGGYGNVDSKQITFNVKANQDFDSISFFDIWDNVFKVGGEIGYVNAYYERLESTMIGNVAFNRPLKSNETCSDMIWCSMGMVDITKLSTALQSMWRDNIGQYASRVTLYEAGKINIDNFTLSLYGEDDMSIALGRFGDINARFGVRMDYDSYMNKATFAPRFSLNYLPFWNDTHKDFATTFNIGANRYYGRNLFAYRLYDARSALQATLVRTSETTAWSDAMITRNKNDTDFRQLNVPYSDEIAVGFVQKIYMFSLSAKYIHRFGRDEIRRSCQAPDGSISALNCSSNVSLTRDLRYVYTNEGRSESDVVSISLQHNKPLEFFGTQNYIMLSFDWTNIRRNYGGYSDVLNNAELANEWISYNGNLIRYADKPAENFVRPYTIRLNTTHIFHIYKTRVLWNNFFRFRSGYTTSVSVSREADKDEFLIDGVLQKVTTFKPFDIKGAFTWDMRFGFEVPVYGRNTLFINIDIFNVLDSKNIAIANLSYTGNAGLSAVPIYEVGRQFWIEVGYKF